MNIKQQTGFTLIELIMVIVILGILSAFAIPKFADVSQQANESVVKSISGSIKVFDKQVYVMVFIKMIETPAKRIKICRVGFI